ncbi:MAG: hypothetical protein ABI076_00565, partial [Acidobacteriaceae bacterium]
IPVRLGDCAATPTAERRVTLTLVRQTHTIEPTFSLANSSKLSPWAMARRVLTDPRSSSGSLAS